MRKTSMIVGGLFLLALCTGCGKSDYAVIPENVALYAQGASESSFFQIFDAAKDQAKVEEADGTTTYTLAEPYTVDGQDGEITVQFANESWSDCYFTFMFEGEDYLKTHTSLCTPMIRRCRKHTAIRMRPEELRS